MKILTWSKIEIARNKYLARVRVCIDHGTVIGIKTYRFTSAYVTNISNYHDTKQVSTQKNADIFFDTKQKDATDTFL